MGDEIIRDNPFRPGAGKTPYELIGRDDEIQYAQSLISSAKNEHFPERGAIFHGVRGVGKTVLLRYIKSLFKDAGWVTAIEEALKKDQSQETKNSIAAQLLEQAETRTSGFFNIFKGMRFTGVKAGLTGISLDFSTATGQSQTILLKTLITELVDASPGRGVAIFIDEMQELEHDTLRELIKLQHTLGQEEKNFYIFGAGLPSLPMVLFRVETYTERLFKFFHIGSLTKPQTQVMFTHSLEPRGIATTDQALETLYFETKGYPYFLQAFGYEIFKNLSDKTIGFLDVLAAGDIVYRELDDSFFRSRWEIASDQEQEYLIIMANYGEDDVPVSYISDSLKDIVTVNNLSTVRNRLIKKHIIHAPKRGSVAFSVPLMGSYIKRLSQFS